MTLQPHIDRHAILSGEKQFRLFHVIGERDWSADLEAGTISFAAPKRRLRRAEPPIEMGVALLGTESEGTWLWGWANPGGFAEPVVAAGRAVGDYGREHDVPPLYEPESAVDDDVTLDRIGIVASGVLGLKFVRDWPAAIGAYERDRGVRPVGGRRARARRSRPGHEPPKSAGLSSIGVPCGVRAAACAHACR